MIPNGVCIVHGSLARASRVCVDLAETDAWAASGVLLVAQPPSDKAVNPKKARTTEILTTPRAPRKLLKRERWPSAEPHLSTLAHTARAATVSSAQKPHAHRFALFTRNLPVQNQCSEFSVLVCR